MVSFRININRRFTLFGRAVDRSIFVRCAEKDPANAAIVFCKYMEHLVEVNSSSEKGKARQGKSQREFE